MIQKPVAISLLTCEQIIVDEGTRNVTPVNCFSKRLVKALPSEGLSFSVFALLTDGIGDTELSVLIKRLDTDAIIFRVRSRFRFDDPLREVRCMIRIHDCSFPVPGPYEVTLLCDDEFIAQRKILVIKQEKLK